MEFGKDYFGFVYKWTNGRNGKYYVGSHYGPVDDNYIGSGMWFKRAYLREPEHFTREILEFLKNDDYDELMLIEKRYLIEVCEVGNKDKCYNISRTAGGGWQLHGKTKQEIDEIYSKISLSLKNRSPEEKAAAIEKARETIRQNPEKLKAAIEKSKQTKKQWSAARKHLMKERMLSTAQGNPEKRIAAIEKGKQTKQNWSEAERLQKTSHLRGPWSEERRQQHREKLKLKAESRTEEEKQRIKNNMSKAQLDRDPGLRKAAYEKGAATFKSRTQEQKDESNRKRSETIAPKRLEINNKISNTKRKDK